MKKVKCQNDHFFDLDRFDRCPICKAPPLDPSLAPDSDRDARSFTDQNGVSVPRPKADRSGPDAGHTEYDPFNFWKREKKQNWEPEPQPEPQPAPEPVPEPLPEPEPAPVPEPKPEPAPEPVPADAGITKADALAAAEEAVRLTAAAAQAAELALSRLQAVKEQTADVVPIPLAGTNASLPGAFLIATEGPRRGQCSICVPGRTRIITGKTQGPGDAFILYDARHRQFCLQAGQNSIWLNNDRLTPDTICILRPYDVIGVGEAAFLFLPLCGRQFDWNQE